MTIQGLAVFDTAIGSCGLAWGARGIAGVQLPEGGPGRTMARLRARFPGVAEDALCPPEIAGAIAAITALLRGEQASTLSEVRLDLSGVPEFGRRVYERARLVPPGRTITYGELAAQLGDPGAARGVGHALGHNPCPIVVPCHRVLAVGGGYGGFSAPGGVATKVRMLTIEGAEEPGLFDL